MHRAEAVAAAEKGRAGRADHPGAQGSAAVRKEDGAGEVIGVRRGGMFGINGSGDTSGYGRLVREVALPGSTPRPYGGYFDDVVDRLAEALGDHAFGAAIERVVVFRNQLTIEVGREHLLGVARALRDDERLRFELCCGGFRCALPAGCGPGAARVLSAAVDHAQPPGASGGGLPPRRRSACAVVVFFGVPDGRLA